MILWRSAAFSGHRPYLLVRSSLMIALLAIVMIMFYSNSIQSFMKDVVRETKYQSTSMEVESISGPIQYNDYSIDVIRIDRTGRTIPDDYYKLYYAIISFLLLIFTMVLLYSLSKIFNTKAISSHRVAGDSSFFSREMPMSSDLIFRIMTTRMPVSDKLGTELPLADEEIDDYFKKIGLNFEELNALAAPENETSKHKSLE